MADPALVARVKELRERRNAVILAHMYQVPEIQDVADYVGDSLGLSHLAAGTDADVIMFCGVHFMAETAAILSPQKTVLIPDGNAGCPMANMVMPRQLRDWREKNPDAVVVTYINSSAAVKAMSDICCTSANAVQVVRSIPEDRRILFVPDRNLGHWVKKTLGRENMELWPGFCPTHERMLPEMVAAMRSEHPRALLVAHPECRPAILEMADHVASTTGILKFCRESDASEFIIATEIGTLYPLTRDNPGKTFYSLAVADCPNMKLNSLEKVAWALEDMSPVVTVPEDVRQKALAPIERMLEIE